MADEKEGGGLTIWQFIIGFVVVLGLLVYLWYQNGGPERADLRGIFLAPPPPVDSGEAYGPGNLEPVESAPEIVE